MIESRASGGHTATLRKGVVGPGEPGHRVFESNFVMECSCGEKAGYATTEERTAERWRDEHLRWHEFHDSAEGATVA